jgi:hypothetical protein
MHSRHLARWVGAIGSLARNGGPCKVFSLACSGPNHGGVAWIGCLSREIKHNRWPVPTVPTHNNQFNNLSPGRLTLSSHRGVCWIVIYLCGRCPPSSGEHAGRWTLLPRCNARVRTCLMPTSRVPPSISTHCTASSPTRGYEGIL